MDGIDDGNAHPDRTGIVIVGGGFGAMNAAMALDRQIERGLRAEGILISRNNFFLFTPLLAEVAACLIEPRHAVNPIRRMLSRVRFIGGTVQELDPGGRTVRFVDKNGRSWLLYPLASNQTVSRSLRVRTAGRGRPDEGSKRAGSL